MIYFDKAKEPFEESSDFGLNISLTISSILILIYFIYPSILIDVVSTLTFF